jgi:hypothetical protein
MSTNTQGEEMNASRSIALLAGALLATPALAGSVLNAKTTEYRGAAPVSGDVQMSTMGSMSRLDIKADNEEDSGTMIFNGSISELVVVDHSRKQYYVIDQEQMDGIAAKVNDATRKMEAALAEMPAEQRAMARQMMQLPEAAPEPPQTTLSKTGESDTIGSHDCEYFDVMQEGRRIRELCVTPWKNFPEGRETAAALIKLGDFFEGMRKAFSQSGGTSLMDRQQDMFSYMDELDGYPVLSRDYGADGTVEYESRLTSSQQTDVDAEVFARPAEYTQQSLQ